MKKIELQTQFPCLIVTEKEESFLSPTDIITIECENILVYPVETRNLLPFKIDLSNPCGKNYRLLEREDKVFCFLFSSLVLYKSAIEKIKVGSKNLEVKIAQSEINIISENEELSFPLDENPTKYTLLNKENFLIILLQNKTKERLLLYCPNTGVFKTYKSKQFEISGSEITFKTHLPLFAKCEVNKKITLKGDEIKEENLECRSQPYRLQEECKAYAFLDCLLEKNFSLARQLLSPGLENVEDSKFIDYFGNFYKFFPLSPYEFALVYPYETRLIKFKMDNGQICDFEFI